MDLKKEIVQPRGSISDWIPLGSESFTPKGSLPPGDYTVTVEMRVGKKIVKSTAVSLRLLPEK
jgi:hypothetical protein